MKFKLVIELGNAAMQTGFDIANALRPVADKTEMMGDMDLASADVYDKTGRVRDLNGNKVGSWEVSD